MLIKLTVFLLAISTLFIATKVQKFFSPPPVPNLDSVWWGEGEEKAEDSSIEPFQVHFSEEAILDLQYRINHTKTFIPPLEGIKQQYGFNTDTLKEVVKFWREEYNWTSRQKYFNKFPQFTTKIQGLKIHFVHVKPEATSGKKVIPLLILHGWPGAVYEFYPMIETFTKPHEDRDFVLEVIAPSLPGFLFSDHGKKAGLGTPQVAVILKNLMLRLGHGKFYLQGSDWGYVTASNLAIMFPEMVLGFHTNFCFSLRYISIVKYLLGSFSPDMFMDSKFVFRLYPVLSKLSDLIEETGYFHLQSTKPDTVGVALGESPAGLAAYFLEKYSTATNLTFRYLDGAGLLLKFDYTQLLDFVSLYWLTGCVTPSMRLYAESFNANYFNLGFEQIPISKSVPCACARFPYEIFYFPDFLLKDKYENLVQITDFPTGGHFAGMELPEILAEDIVNAIKKMENLI